ncbi:MAG TPA: hypothetical protein VNT51_01710 [Miltoncostaeaceae bacterium]|nr:hypothetical protein [Miltoncostaeaceae bacterium]
MDGTVMEVDGVRYQLVAEPVRSSLSDSAAMLWGFPVRILRDGERIATKTCFVGRISVAALDPQAPDAPAERLVPVLHELAFARIRNRLEKGELGDEIVFA